MPVTPTSGLSPVRCWLNNINGSSNPNTSPRRKCACIEGPEPSAIQPLKMTLPQSLKAVKMTSVSNSIVQEGNTHFSGDLNIVAGATRSLRIDIGTSTPAIPAIISDSNPSTSPLADILHTVHLNQLALQKQMTEGKGTEDAYPQHIKNYETFWEWDQDCQAKENLNHCWISAHLIIGKKVVIFLEHKRTHNKVYISYQWSYNIWWYPQHNNHGHEINGSSIGKGSIKQSINALQWFMKDHQHLPEYQSCPETQMVLQDQEWVKVYETAASTNEPTHIKNAHALKAKGTSAGNFSQYSFLQV